MNILLIDNESKYLTELLKLASCDNTNQMQVIKHTEISSSKIRPYDLIILSGGHGHGVINHEDEYGKEVDLIRTVTKPILGICLGCELIAYAYGSRLELLDTRESNMVEIEFLGNDPVVKDMNNMKVHESHKWYIKDLGSELKALAKSKDGIEIIRHINRPIYGFQFHPELDEKQGATLLNNLIKLVG